MSVFDAYIRKVAEYVDSMLGAGRQIRVFDCPGDASSLLAGLPVKVGPGAGSGIVLRGDTYAELGSPDAGSCAFPLWTNNPDLISDGRITLIGPDILESQGASLPFGQIVIAGGKELGEKEHSALDEGQYVSDQIEGYMVKSTPGRMWTRISNDAADRGFGFESLGKALMAIYKSRVPQIEAMAVVFVTSDKEDVQRLDDIAEQVRKISKDIVRETWLARGYDILECTLGWDCSTCDDKSVCDDIKEVIKVRKKKAKKAAKSQGR
ncbi:MAG: carbon monoxide dehydrogenase [Dehalococcoidia bacterium]|nr:MAG: carbon monoxide dehydrogenase [Dehalococcoidia bacterium]